MKTINATMANSGAIEGSPVNDYNGKKIGIVTKVEGDIIHATLFDDEVYNSIFSTPPINLSIYPKTTGFELAIDNLLKRDGKTK